MAQNQNIREIRGNVIRERIDRLTTLKQRMAEGYLKKTCDLDFKGIIIKNRRGYEVLTENYLKIPLPYHKPNHKHGQLVLLRYQSDNQVKIVANGQC